MAELSEQDKAFLADESLRTLRGPKKTSHTLLLVILFLIFVAFLWSAYFEIDEVIRGTGKVIPSQQIQIIQNLEGGIVKKIFVREGETVQKNQPLMQIDDTRFSASFRENQIKIRELEITLARLRAEVENKPFAVSAELAKQQPQEVKYERALYESRKEELTQLINNYKLAVKELQLTKPLVSKGAASPVEVLRLERIVSQLKGEISKFQSKTLDQLNNVKTELDSLKQSRITSEDRLVRTTVRSPVKGIIKRILINTIGGVVKPGMDLLEIVPLDDTLLIEAKISPRDVGFLHPGLKAIVTLTAYDFSEYGGLDGKLEHISSDAITDEVTKDQYYLIRIRTQKNYLGTKENPLYIIPGMIANVDIITGKKTILNYILHPITRGLKKALTEK